MNTRYNSASVSAAVSVADLSRGGSLKERFINRKDKLVIALPYEATSSNLSNWLVNFEDYCTAASQDSDQDQIRPAEIWGKMDSGWQSEILKDSFKSFTW